jgi:putative colanic acid biosynthesis acetyltransferase WcaF
MSELKVDLSKFENWLSTKNKIGRALWAIANIFLFKPFFLSFFNPWRLFVLRCFGAKLSSKSNIYSSVNIWAPWNLEMEEYSTLAAGVTVYNTGKVKIGKHTTISQRAYLCPGSHDIYSSKFPMICTDLIIEDQVWIATEAFVGGMGVTIGEGAVVGARACVFKDVEPWTIVGGNPAKFIKKREIKNA